MFSENEVLLLIISVLAIYIGVTVLWNRLLIAAEINSSMFSSKFTIETADRIFSVFEDYVRDGIWCQVVITLWRSRKTREFYLSRTYEYNDGKPLQEFQYVDKFKAKEIIQKFAPKDIAPGLIADWIERTNRAI